MNIQGNPKNSKKGSLSANDEIVDRDSPILRQVAKPVAVRDITSKRIQSIILRMKKALDSQEDGVAIAAPQIGEPFRIFVVSRKVAEMENLKALTEDMVFINPEILKLSREKKEVPEGCLSVRYFYGNVLRSTKAVIRAYNEQGEQFERGGSGLLAQIFQHETDHLNGVLFTDKALDIEEILPEENEEKPKKI